MVLYGESTQKEKNSFSKIQTVKNSKKNFLNDSKYKQSSRKKGTLHRKLRNKMAKKNFKKSQIWV